MKDRVSRRDFLVRLGRGAGVVGLTTLVGRLVLNTLRGTTLNGARSPELCARCPALGRCELPEAIEVRRRTKTPSTGRVQADRSGLCGHRPA